MIHEYEGYYSTPIEHLIIIGTFLDDSKGVGVVPTMKDPTYFRELAVHSASAEMTLKPMAKLMRAIVDKFPKNLRPDLVEIVDRLKHATNLWEEAAALQNPDRRKSFEQRNSSSST